MNMIFYELMICTLPLKCESKSLFYDICCIFYDVFLSVDYHVIILDVAMYAMTASLFRIKVTDDYLYCNK